MIEEISMPDPNAPSRKIDNITHVALDKKQIIEHLGLSPDASKAEILAEVQRRAQEHHDDYMWHEEFESALGIDPGALTSPGARPEAVRMARVQEVSNKLSSMLGDDKTIVRLSADVEELTGAARAGAAFQKQFEAPAKGGQLTVLHVESRNHDIAKGRAPVLLTADVLRNLEPLTCTATEKLEILSAFQMLASMGPGLLNVASRIEVMNAQIEAAEQTVAALELLSIRAEVEGIRKALGRKSRVGLTGLDLYSATIEDQIAANPQSAMAHDDAMIQKRHTERAAAMAEKDEANRTGVYRM